MTEQNPDQLIPTGDPDPAPSPAPTPDPAPEPAGSSRKSRRSSSSSEGSGVFAAYDKTLLRYVGGTHDSEAKAKAAAKDAGVRNVEIREV